MKPFVCATVAIALAASPALSQEKVDYTSVQRIRDEALGNNSQVMETIRQLTDVIGPRLTGSPNMKRANEWTRKQLEDWGIANAHLEQWGPFGRGWSYDKSTVTMVAPDTAALIALPKAWTPGTNGAVKGKVIRPGRLESDADLEKWKGKLEGAILLVGDARELKAPDANLFSRFDEEGLQKLSMFEIPRRPGAPAAAGGPNADPQAFVRRAQFARTLREFFAKEKVLATIDPSGLDAGMIRIGGGGSRVKGEETGPLALVMAAEHYNRIARLLDKNVPVELEVDVKARFHDDDPMQYNTIAEIPGSDPVKKNEIVMVGAHLDSWHPATGATDNAAGSGVAMEVMRILKDMKPKRTIRIGLWTGEEQGLLGSRAYVTEHFGGRPAPAPGAPPAIPGGGGRGPQGPITIKPDQAKVSAYFNLDNGTGEVRGVYAQQNAAAVDILQSWIKPFADLGATTVSMRNTGGTDHLSFDAVGIPGFQMIQDEADYDTRTHHTNLDTYDRIQRDDMMQASAIMASLVLHAANREELFPRKPLPKDTIFPPVAPPPALGKKR